MVKKGISSFNVETQRLISVDAIFDLNEMPALDVPAVKWKTKKFGYLCCKSRTLLSTIGIPRTGYAPGEKIPIYAYIENFSNKTLIPQACLIQNVTFHSDNADHKKFIKREIQVVTLFEKSCSQY